jgi:MFS family permease
MLGYFRLLRDNPNYARLWYAQAISLFGDWFSSIALLTLVTSYSSQPGSPIGSGMAIGLFLMTRFLSPLLVGPFAGVLVDRLNRKRLLILSDIVRSGIVLAFLLVRGPEHLWLIYALSILQFSLSALFEPGRSAIIPSLVSSEDLVKANLLGSVTWSVMLAAGAWAGGFVADKFGNSTAFIIDAFTFILSALFIASIRWVPIPDSEKHEHHKSELGFMDGLRYVMRHPATAAVLLVKAGGSVGSIDTLMTIYATELFVLGAEGKESLGYLYAAFGLGAILGPIALERFNNGTVQAMRRLITVGYAAIVIGWFLFGAAPSLLLVAVAILIKAMGSSVYWTYSSVIIQKDAPDKFLGRLFSLDLAGFQLITVISTLITGAVIDSIGKSAVRSVVFGTGILSVLPLVLWMLALPWIERKDIKQQNRVPIVER